MKSPYNCKPTIPKEDDSTHPKGWTFVKFEVIKLQNSENDLNEILAGARMKSADADEICFADEMKSTHRHSDFIRP